MLIIILKWTAPEVLKFGKITTASDVWSFGICLWELFTKGETPYSAISDQQSILDQLDTGYRLPKPRKCADEIYAIMVACWKEEYAERPTFDEILKMLKIEPMQVEQKRPLSLDVIVAQNQNYV